MPLVVWDTTHIKGVEGGGVINTWFLWQTSDEHQGGVKFNGELNMYREGGRREGGWGIIPTGGHVELVVMARLQR